MLRKDRFLRVIFIFVALGIGQKVSAQTYEQAILGLAAESRMELKEAIKQVGRVGDARALPILMALKEKRLRIDDANKKVYVVDNEEDTTAKDVLSGENIDVASIELRTPKVTNVIRRSLKTVIAQFNMFNGDSESRLQAAVDWGKRATSENYEEILTALEKEKDPLIVDALEFALARAALGSDDEERIQKGLDIVESRSLVKLKSELLRLVTKDESGAYLLANESIRRQAQKLITRIESKEFVISQTGNLLYGLSLGSILLLAALGLAITFGLMGVINMAHGEMLMLGAYTTFVVQNLFAAYLPSMLDFYIVAAIPMAFLVSAMVGVAVERSVIQYLYGRPLETLLATWGISLVLIQTVRLIFGAQNVEVANPSFLSGGVEIMAGLVLPYNRIAIVLFVVFVVSLVWYLLQKTPLGMMVRAVQQNRAMAASMGINTQRVDMWTFALGSGVAGLGGVALSQVGNVGPELGQAYIVDSFMVVVLGGVGNILGTIFGALGLGMVNKFLEPLSGAVLAKIMVLVFIILFIQKRPQGIFALKGRMAEA